MINKNLILTILHQYNYPIVEPFIKSLKETGYKDDLVIFTSSSVSRGTKNTLKKKGATLIEINDTFPFYEPYKNAFKEIDPSITLNNYRFILYLKYLEDNGDKYNNVMLTDIRDVVFQKNPFDYPIDNKVYFFLEDPSEIFLTSQMNYGWCVYANGIELTNSIIDKNVSCAGIVIGHRPLIIQYLNYMKQRLSNRKDLKWGLDQGIHNEYVHTITNPGMVASPNSYPYVLTLGACKSFKQNSEGLLINDIAEPYYVVHQYDRFGDLIVYFKKKYIGNRFVQRIKKMLFLLLP